MEDILIHNSVIWTLDNCEIIPAGWLTAKNGLISAIGTGEPPESIQAKTVIDGRGKLLMPGLVDCHTHLMEYATAEVNHAQGQAQKMAAVTNLFLALHSGIVATGEHHLGHPVLDMPTEKYKEILEKVPMASALACGCCWLGFEPKVLTSSTRPGAAFTSDTLTDEDFIAMAESSDFAGENLFLNYTCANAPLSAAPNAGGVTYEKEKLKHIVDLFHSRGKGIGAHIEGDASARLFIECGGNVIHHGHALSPELGELMAEKNVALVLTPVAGTSKKPTSPADAFRFYKQGVFLALASDSYIYPHPQADWISLDQNRLVGPAEFLGIVGSTMRHFKECGVNESEILRLITVNPRKLLHPDEPFGVLKPGCPADMILCDKLPGLDTEDPADIKVVITQGTVQIDKRT